MFRVHVVEAGRAGYVGHAKHAEIPVHARWEHVNIKRVHVQAARTRHTSSISTNCQAAPPSTGIRMDLCIASTSRSRSRSRSSHLNQRNSRHCADGFTCWRNAGGTHGFPLGMHLSKDFGPTGTGTGTSTGSWEHRLGPLISGLICPCRMCSSDCSVAQLREPNQWLDGSSIKVPANSSHRVLQLLRHNHLDAEQCTARLPQPRGTPTASSPYYYPYLFSCCYHSFACGHMIQLLDQSTPPAYRAHPGRARPGLHQIEYKWHSWRGGVKVHVTPNGIDANQGAARRDFDSFGYPKSPPWYQHNPAPYRRTVVRMACRRYCSRNARPCV